jgi:hypothetical protein
MQIGDLEIVGTLGFSPGEKGDLSAMSLQTQDYFNAE